jgi:translocation and assembly module TamB
MLVESWPGGRHSFPHVPGGRREDAGPRPFTTTLRHVLADHGRFVYEDHGTPWSVEAPNLSVTVGRTEGEYRGSAIFDDGTVRIQSYEPMGVAARAHFEIDGGIIRMDRVDLQTDGAESVLTGEIDAIRWPEQSYQVRSRVQFAPMREIFFAGHEFHLSGEGDFDGVFHLFRGGRELKGRFASPMAGLDDYRFPGLEGSLVWTEERLEVIRASSEFYGGRMELGYVMAPLGRPEPAVARLDVRYADVDLARFTDFLQTRGLRLDGRATGRNVLEWPLGAFPEHRGDGHVRVRPPTVAAVMGGTVPPALLAHEAAYGPEVGPFNPLMPLGYVPVGGEVVYAFGPEWIHFEPSWVATPKTHVEFNGRTAYGDRSRIPFRVTSADWQESDRVLAGVMTAFGSPTGAVEIGGHGEFDGVMLESVGAPRIEGRFRGERMRAWDVEWGSGAASIVIENAYVDVTDAIVRQGGSAIHATGRFSLGFPRRDGGEEINARIRLDRRPLADLRHAFELDEYPVDGLVSGEYHIFGAYHRPHGFGRLSIADGVAYGEPFEAATAGLRFEGEGVRLDGLEIRKGTGLITGAAYVAWAGTYSFNADGQRIPVESLARLETPRAPLSGLLQFAASGAGSFEFPRYDVRGRLDDLFAGDEGIGQATGRLSVRGDLMTIEVEVASARLAVSGSGRIALTDESDAELTFRFADTSLDPYVRFFEPRLSPFTRAVASGSIRVSGELANPDHLLVAGTIEQLNLELFDYAIVNDGPIVLALDQNVVRMTRMRLAGEGTQLDLTGEIRLADEQIAVRATGDANLGLLQGFFRDIRSSGVAELVAEITGPLREPRVSGLASLTSGRIRHFSLPHSLEALDGSLVFDAGGIRLDGVTGRLGGGLVRFGGRIELDGYGPGVVAVTAAGERMTLRYPEGFRSVVDADLRLEGDFYSPLLRGQVLVHSAFSARRFDAMAIGFGGPVVPAPPPPAGIEETLPLRYDVRVVAPSTLRLENNTARLLASADLTLSGTFDRPLLFGRVEIERGEALFEGHRYFLTRGSIDFANPTRIEPFFDIEAETRVRVPGETYRIVFQATGPMDRLVTDLSSDPPLPIVDIVSLLFGDLRDPQNAELRALERPGLEQQELLQARAARLLASPIASGVGRVVEQTLGIDSVQIMPSFIDPSQQLNPTARVTIGKRISNRLFLTYSRLLTNASQDQIILLEYDQTDHLSWILSQNGDNTYALDFRVRHTF